VRTILTPQRDPRLLGLFACVRLTDASAAFSASARRAHLEQISSSSSSVCAVLTANKFVQLNLNRRTVSILRIE
jgi:hypothetical protein